MKDYMNKKSSIKLFLIALIALGTTSAPSDYFILGYNENWIPI